MNLQRMRLLAGLSLNESVQSIPSLAEGITAKQIDSAQQDIDLDQGSQFTEKAQVVSCNQSNHSNVVNACAMNTSTVVNETDDDEKYDQILQAIAAIFGPEVWDMDSMQDLAQTLEQANPTDQEIQYIIKTGALPPRLVNLEFNQGDSFQFDEAYDINNGYNDKKVLDGQDYFPTGADGSVVKKTGPSGAKQGDNPEQKKMDVAETHKELVYSYRNFLKEAALTELSKDTMKSYANKKGAGNVTKVDIKAAKKK